MGRCVIVGYRPKPGKRPELREAIAKYIAILRDQKLITEREPLAMATLCDSVVLVVEWESAAAIERAHKNEAVTAAWAALGELCDYRPLASLQEANEMFAEFEVLPL